VSENHVAAPRAAAHVRERRDLSRRALCDAIAGWFDLHPSALAPLDRHTVTRMASRVSAAPAAQTRPGALPRVLDIDGFRVDRGRRTVHALDRPLRLSPTEFDLLVLLLTRVHVVQSSSALTRRLWGSDADRHKRSLFVYVRRLRSRLEQCDGVPFRITTVRGRGYRIDMVADVGAGAVAS
jgi:DNA-binding response OmpR family regulator